MTVAEVWPRYMAEGKPKRKAAWKPRYVADLNRAASLGGEPKKRGKGLTKPGHLAAGPSSAIHNPGQLTGGSNSVARNPDPVPGAATTLAPKSLAVRF